MFLAKVLGYGKQGDSPGRLPRAAESLGQQCGFCAGRSDVCAQVHTSMFTYK